MRFFVILLFLGNIIMAATIEKINIKDKEVTLIHEHDTRLPIVTLQVVFTNGGKVATSKPGLARLSAKILGEGTKKLGSSAFAEALEAKAIHLSASAGDETFVIELSVLRDYFEDGLGFLEQLLEDPNLSDTAMQKVKTTTIGNLSAKESDFDYIASNELSALLFSKTPLANPSSGTIEDVESITKKDVKNFLKEHLVLSRAIVLVGGDIELEPLKQKLPQLLANLPKGEAKEVGSFVASDKRLEKILYKESEQAYIYFGAPYFSQVGEKDTYKAKVAAFILGAGGFGSRLMEEIRVKKGLAYSAYARVHINRSASYFSGHLQTKNESLEEAKKSVIEVIEKFVKEGATQEELEQTKKFMLGSEPLRVETMSQRLNRTFMEFYRGEPLGYSQEELRLIEQLTLDELNAYITSHPEIGALSFSIVTKKLTN